MQHVPGVPRPNKQAHFCANICRPTSSDSCRNLAVAHNDLSQAQRLRVLTAIHSRKPQNYRSAPPDADEVATPLLDDDGLPHSLATDAKIEHDDPQQNGHKGLAPCTYTTQLPQGRYRTRDPTAPPQSTSDMPRGNMRRHAATMPP